LFRSRRFGGNLFCQLPLGLSCVHGFITCDATVFKKRTARLLEVTGLLSDVFNLADNKIDDEAVVEFVPNVPQVSLVHIYINAPVELAIAARDHVIATTGDKTSHTTDEIDYYCSMD
jgi:hypothetical protein